MLGLQGLISISEVEFSDDCFRLSRPLPTLLFGLAAFSLSSLGLALSTEFVTVAILRAFQGESPIRIIICVLNHVGLTWIFRI